MAHAVLRVRQMTATIEPPGTDSEPTFVVPPPGGPGRRPPSETEQAPLWAEPPTPRHPPEDHPAASPPEPAIALTWPPRHARKPPIFWVAVVVGVIVLVLGAVVVVLAVESNVRPVHTSATRPSSSVTTAPSRATAPEPTTPATTPSTAVTTPSPTQPASPSGGGLPEIGSIAPASGPAGQSVVISGTDLFSADGVVQVFFGTQDAPVRCPSQTSCTAVVPELPGPARTLPVTVSTEAGTSNALSFSYQF